MKFQNAILSIATATLSGVNNNVVDAKLWNLRGFGNVNNNNNNNIIEEVHSESLPSVAEELPSPTANLRELIIEEQQGERRLPKKKNKGKDKEDKAETDEGGKKGKGKGSKGQKDEKIGEAVYTEAPDDVIAKAGCDEPMDEEDDGARFRRFLAKGDKDKEKIGKTKGTKANKEDLSTGACESFSTNEERTQEDVDTSGVDVPVEAAEFPTCDPDAEEPCEDEEFLDDDPTMIPPDDYEEVEGEAFEATSRELMERDLIEGRRLTGNTNQIGDFAPLSCNPVEFDCTGAAGLSSVVSDASSPVTVPCGTCLVVSK